MANCCATAQELWFFKAKRKTFAWKAAEYCYCLPGVELLFFARLPQALFIMLLDA
jgi:hypothetical protein